MCHVASEIHFETALMEVRIFQDCMNLQDLFDVQHRILNNVLGFAVHVISVQ